MLNISFLICVVKRFTLDPLLRVSNQIQQGFGNRCQAIGVFFFFFFIFRKPVTHHKGEGIIRQFHKMGTQGNMIKFIDSFPLDRNIRVKVGRSISRPFLQEEVIPKSSVLNVTCFAVAINRITETVFPPVKKILFVDGFAIYYTGYNASSVVCRYLQKSVDAVREWADVNGCKFSTFKTMAEQFTRCR